MSTGLCVYVFEGSRLVGIQLFGCVFEGGSLV